LPSSWSSPHGLAPHGRSPPLAALPMPTERSVKNAYRRVLRLWPQVSPRRPTKPLAPRPSSLVKHLSSVGCAQKGDSRALFTHCSRRS
jgi:hypothetical protein